MCRHCSLDGTCLALEMRLFAVHTRSIAAGSVVTAEEALRQVCSAPCSGFKRCHAGPPAPLCSWPSCRTCCARVNHTAATGSCRKPAPAHKAALHLMTLTYAAPDHSYACHLTSPVSVTWTGVQAQAAALRRVGQGGLGETAGEGAAPEQPGLEQGRRGEVVAGSDLLRQPCQADTAMRVLAQQLRQVKHASAGAPTALWTCCCDV